MRRFLAASTLFLATLSLVACDDDSGGGSSGDASGTATTGGESSDGALMDLPSDTTDSGSGDADGGTTTDTTDGATTDTSDGTTTDTTTTGGDTCGDGVIGSSEQCDGMELNDFDCAGLGFGSGTLACDPVTCTYDTSGCMGSGSTGTSGL